MTTTAKLTQAVVKSNLADLGISFRSRDGEFRVNYSGGAEATAYYTNDLRDALDTGCGMVAARAARQTSATAAPAFGIAPAA